MTLSELPTILNALGVNKIDQFTLIAMGKLQDVYFPPFSPDEDVIIMDILSEKELKKLEDLLRLEYPPDTNLIFAFQDDGKNWVSVNYTLQELGHLNFPSYLYIHPCLKNSSLESFENLIAHLRAPEGCPWDREQTHKTLRSNLIEETYEVLQALDSGNADDLREELGDLLLQIVLHAQISNEAGEFNLPKVVAGIHQKLVHRHPHVFGDEKIQGADGVLRNWEVIKAGEREENQKNNRNHILTSIPTSMPALLVAQEYQKRAARVGFDWPELQPVLDKVYEELNELKEANTNERKSEELGDLLFAVVNLARWNNIEAESALRQMNQRFLKRFSFIETKVQEDGHKLQELNLTELDAWWDKAKREGL